MAFGLFFFLSEQMTFSGNLQHKVKGLLLLFLESDT